MQKETSWFTFGQNHTHSVNGLTYDKDIVVEITAKDPRERMVKVFGNKWSLQYNSKPDMSFFPRGIKKLIY